jgi:type II secretory ATPase GspE/PulE/Tfp pilus assembly ATPase PilB-like protein
MTQQTIRPLSLHDMTEPQSNHRDPSLHDAAQALLDGIGDELRGPRQATLQQLVEHLGRTFQLSQSRAEKLFDCLKSARLVVWVQETKGANITGNGHRHRWHISTEPPVVVDQNVQRIKQDEVAGSDPDGTRPAADLIHRAIDARATDIHLDPYRNETPASKKRRR